MNSFNSVIHEIDYFCSTEMSATYLDILKDRLYTFPADSALRRGSQTVLLEIVTGLAKLMAPILSFTAEEIWQSLAATHGQVIPRLSVHMADFPDPIPIPNEERLGKNWKELLKVRNLVLGVLEKKRREKEIGSSLEAKVCIMAPQAQQYDMLNFYRAELPTLFIVSQVEIQLDENWGQQNVASEPLGYLFKVTKAEGTKCDRCWNIRQDVGLHAQHPTLCGRCVEALALHFHRFVLLSLVVTLIVSLDQITKAYIINTMHLHESITIIPGYFNLTYIRNPGAAFGIMGTTSSGFRLIFFFLTSLFAMGLLITIFLRLDMHDWWGQMTIASIFGGAIGNFIDRLQYGEVIDFLDFYINGYHWPAFNVADSAISVGVCSLLLLFAFEKRKPKFTPQEDPH